MENKTGTMQAGAAEEELLEYLADPQNREDACNAELARMAAVRLRTEAPDVEEELARVRAASAAIGHGSPAAASRHLFRYAASFLLGAAAMFVGFIVYQHLNAQQSDHTRMLSAIAYKDTPQAIVLESDDQQTTLSQDTPLSFLRVATAQPNDSAVQKPDVTRKASSGIQRLSTPRGMDFKIILADGTEVWLNAESTIEFPSAFTAAERRVNLKGEAYFKVAHDEKCPFIVCSEKMNVRVLGTEFNIKCYDTEATHVSLIRGSVEVMKPDGRQAEVRLRPGQEVWADQGGNMHVGEADTYAVTQWVSGYFYFDNQPLVNVLCELGRWYNLGVVFKNQQSMNYKMHFSASRRDDIQSTIRNLNALHKEQIRLEGNDLVVY